MVVIGSYSITTVPDEGKGDKNEDKEKSSSEALVQVTARVIKVNEGRTLGEVLDGGWATRQFDFGGPLTSLQDIHGRLAYQILYQREKAFAFSQNQLVQEATKVPQRAFEAYVKGVLLNERHPKRENYLKNALRFYADANGDAVYTQAAFELGRYYMMAGKWKDAFDDCTLIEEYYADETFKAECNKVFANADKITGEGLLSVMFRCESGEKIKKVAPDFEKACKTLATGQLAAAQKAATAARDAGKNDYKVCSDLKKAAELTGGDAVAAAAKQCDEMGAAEDAKKAADEARANAAAKKTSVPYQCDTAAEKLAKIETEWAKKTLDDVYKACYVELGAVVFAEKGKDAKFICPYEIKKITDGITKHDLATKFPELADAMKKLPAKCK